MEYGKLIINVPKDEMVIIDEACKIDRRTRASLTLKTLIPEAKKIIKENKNADN